jgi:uncharacterized protein
MPLRQVGVEILDRDECFRLLESASLGRIGFTTGAIPQILPVTYAVLDGDIVFRTGSGTKIEAALRRQVACFEADSLDSRPRRGWSVLVTGRTEIVSHPRVLEQAAELDIEPWCGEGLGDRLVRLRTSLVSGRWLKERQPSPGVDGDRPAELGAATVGGTDLEAPAEGPRPVLQVP